MSRSPTIDPARLELMLTELRLPAMKAMWPQIAAQSDKEGWPASRFLSCLAEQEMADRSRRRIARHLAGDSWLRSGVNLLLFGGQGAGVSEARNCQDRGSADERDEMGGVDRYAARTVRLWLYSRERPAHFVWPGRNWK